MKALVFEGIKNAKVKDVSEPTINHDGVLLKVKANGVCRSDWHKWIGDIPITNPILGHEMSGVIEEVGRNIKNFKKGDRVIVPFSGGDGTCRHCQAGNSHLCDSYVIPGTGYPGGYGEYVAVPLGDLNVMHLPEEVSFTDAAALGCRFMTAFHGVADQVKVHPGEWVAIYGCGGVGLSAVNIATAMGANVIAVDVNEENLNLAKQMGAIFTINPKDVDPIEGIKELTNGGASVSIDALGIKETCVNSIMSLNKRGRHLQIGLTTKREAGYIPIPVDHMVRNEIQFITSLGMPSHRFSSMISLVAQGRLTPSKMVNREISLSEVTSIFEAMSNYSATGTFVVTKFD